MTPTTAYDYRAKIVRWIDGDTVQIDIDLGFDVTTRQTVRLKGIDTPELKSKDAVIRQAAVWAREKAMQLAPEGTTIRVQSEKGFAQEKYGRYLATINTSAGLDVSRELIRMGHGVAYMAAERIATSSTGDQR